MFFSILKLVLGFFPAPIQLFVLGLLGFFAILIVFKIVAFVLDSIPFL